MHEDDLVPFSATIPRVEITTFQEEPSQGRAPISTKDWKEAG
jgi:hypothetical protein